MLGMRKAWYLRSAALSLAGVLAAGCSLMNPHVTAEMKRPIYGDIMAGKTKGAPVIPFAGGAGDAIDYANSWRDEYYDAVGDQSLLTNGIALAAIPASATALYFGVSGDASRDVITGIATGTAGVVGLGAFLDGGDRRQLTYLAGHRALGCVILAARPLLMPKPVFDGLETNLGKLEGKLATAKAVQNALASANSAGPIKGELDANIANAESALSGGYALKGQIQRAGLEIVTRVDTIVARVSEEVVKTEPNLAAITDITGGLAGASQKLVNIPKNAEGIGGKKLSKEEEKLYSVLRSKFNINSPQSANAELIAATIPVASVVNEYVTLAQSVDKIESCHIDAVKAGLAIQPSTEAVTLKKGGTYSFALSGGKTPYSAGPLGSLPKGVEVKVSPFNQQPASVTVVAGKDSEAGSFAVIVGDGSGETRVINFTIQ